MIYQKEIVHSPKRFEQWHFRHTIIQSPAFRAMQVQLGGYGVHDVDFFVERIAKRGFGVIVLCISGRGRFLLESGEEIILSPGEAFLSSPEGQGHREETLGPEPFEHLWLILSPSSPLMPCSVYDHSIIRFSGTGLMRELVRLIIEEDLRNEGRDTVSLELSERLLLQILMRISEPRGRSRSEGRKAQLAELWKTVSQHPEKPWNVADLCSIAACSRSQLTRLCQSIYHQSPGERVREMKMEYAKMLLAHSTMSIHEVAEEVGFTRSSLFSSSFASYEGTSPREYRKKASGQS